MDLPWKSFHLCQADSNAVSYERVSNVCTYSTYLLISPVFRIPGYIIDFNIFNAVGGKSSTLQISFSSDLGVATVFNHALESVFGRQAPSRFAWCYYLLEAVNVHDFQQFS